ncbi:MAG TPA: hypothetical protein VIH90_07105 [Candidatus Saccharimonadales bacterium]
MKIVENEAAHIMFKEQMWGGIELTGTEEAIQLAAQLNAHAQNMLGISGVTRNYIFDEGVTGSAGEEALTVQARLLRQLASGDTDSDSSFSFILRDHHEAAVVRQAAKIDLGDKAVRGSLERPLSRYPYVGNLMAQRIADLFAEGRFKPRSGVIKDHIVGDSMLPGDLNTLYSGLDEQRFPEQRINNFDAGSGSGLTYFHLEGDGRRSTIDRPASPEIGAKRVRYELLPIGEEPQIDTRSLFDRYGERRGLDSDIPTISEILERSRSHHVRPSHIDLPGFLGLTDRERGSSPGYIAYTGPDELRAAARRDDMIHLDDGSDS